MKKLIFAISFLAFASLLSAQTEYPVNETQATMSKGNHTAYTITLTGTDKKDLEERWCKFMKEYDAKGKKNKKSGEIFSDNAEIKNLSSNTVDVYAKFNENEKNNTQLVVWFDLGGAYLSSSQHADKVPAAENVIRRFSREVIKDQIAATLDAQKDQLKDMEKDLKKMGNDKEDLEKDIKNYEEKIQDARAKIDENLKMQADKRGEISKQETTVKQTESLMKSYKN